MWGDTVKSGLRRNIVDWSQPLPSYLNETFTFARYVSTFPSLSCTSSFSISAIRRSLKDLASISIAALAALSHDSVLVHTHSMTSSTETDISSSSCLALQRAIHFLSQLHI